jgi:hypothetical protein
MVLNNGTLKGFHKIDVVAPVFAIQGKPWHKNCGSPFHHFEASKLAMPNNLSWKIVK